VPTALNTWVSRENRHFVNFHWEAIFERAPNLFFSALRGHQTFCFPLWDGTELVLFRFERVPNLLFSAMRGHQSVLFHFERAPNLLFYTLRGHRIVLFHFKRTPDFFFSALRGHQTFSFPFWEGTKLFLFPFETTPNMFFSSTLEPADNYGPLCRYRIWASVFVCGSPSIKYFCVISITDYLELCLPSHLLYENLKIRMFQIHITRCFRRAWNLVSHPNRHIKWVK
jgi:hypothetical protein